MMEPAQAPEMTSYDYDNDVTMVTLEPSEAPMTDGYDYDVTARAPPPTGAMRPFSGTLPLDAAADQSPMMADGFISPGSATEDRPFGVPPSAASPEPTRTRDFGSAEMVPEPLDAPAFDAVPAPAPVDMHALSAVPAEAPASVARSGGATCDGECAPTFGQCAGSGITGSLPCCERVYAPRSAPPVRVRCVKKSAHYSQCRPASLPLQPAADWDGCEHDCALAAADPCLRR
jgi:hypothetical protein